MNTVAHLLDDTNVGGVTRGLASHLERLMNEFSVRQVVVDTTHAIASDLPDDMAIIHFTPSWAKLPYMLTLRAKLAGRPLVFVEHTYTECFERLCVPNRMRFRLMLKLSYRLCDAVVAVSHGQARWLVETGAVPESKLAVICSARDCSMLQDLPPPQRHAGPMKLAAYGRYCDQKGFEVAIEAMRRLPPGLATLTLAGYGPLEQRLRQLAQGCDNIEVQGAIGDLRTFLADHDAVVIPSRWEAFGIVAAEARAAARPVIASDVDGLREQVVAGSGFLVPPENPAQLADAICRLAQADWATMGLTGRASVASHFDDHVSRWNALLRSCAGDLARRSAGTPADAAKRAA